MNILLREKLGTLLVAGFTRMMSIAQRLRIKPARLAVITYHKIVSHDGPYLADEIIVSDFDWQIKALKRYFNILPLSEAIDLLQEDRLPPLALCVTIDDGYRNILTEAAPILSKYHVPATIFVTTQFTLDGLMWHDVVEQSIRKTELSRVDLAELDLPNYVWNNAKERINVIDDISEKIKYYEHRRLQQVVEIIQQKCGVTVANDIMLSVEQLAKLSDFNIEVGGHTVSHPILTRISDEQAENEIRECKQSLEHWTQREIKFFAYPNGKPQRDYAPQHMEMVAAAGYKAAFNTRYGAADKSDNIYDLPRLSAWGENTAQFVLHVARSY